MKASGGTAHILGLLSPGGVHSHQDHMVALAVALADAGVPVAVHAFLDGRDTPPSSGKGFVEKFLADVAGHAVRIATVSGRYYGMDRDKRWDRVGLAYRAMVDGAGAQAADAAISAIEASYQAGQTDEFVLPTVIGGYRRHEGRRRPIMANFRADRAREILGVLVDPTFDGFARGRVAAFRRAPRHDRIFIGSQPSSSTCCFRPKAWRASSASWSRDAGLSQLRIAETEKYAHVTFFFNGGREEVYPDEDRILVPSPKVATYDLQPAMSAPEVTDKLVAAVESGKYDLIVVNYANGDMVGHTGILEAAIKAVEAVDACLGRLTAAVQRAGGVPAVTADHGNAELMRDPVTGEPYTAHTIGKVPVVLACAPGRPSAA